MPLFIFGGASATIRFITSRFWPLRGILFKTNVYIRASKASGPLPILSFHTTMLHSAGSTTTIFVGAVNYEVEQPRQARIKD